MRIAILGTGDAGRALGKGFITLGHEVKMGSREAGNEKAVSWAKQMGPNASAGTFAQAVAFGDLVVLATLGAANPSVIAAAGPEAFRGKVVIDATNPLDFSGGRPPKLSLGHTDSGGEQVQRLLPGARVVKAFNIIGNPSMFRPDFPGGPPDMFFCGDDAEAKAQVASILTDFGHRPLDVGGIASSKYLEAMCMVWVLHGARTGRWNHAFKLLEK